VREATGGLGPDVVFEAAGVPAAFREALDAVRRGGKVIELGHYSDPGGVEIRPHLVCQKDVDILGCWSYPPIQFRAGLSFLTNARAPILDLFTHLLPLDRVEEGIRMTGGEGVLKVAVRP
jgi:L-iditol 2-dehydrogenase